MCCLPAALRFVYQHVSVTLLARPGPATCPADAPLRCRARVFAISGDQITHLAWRLQNGEGPQGLSPQLATIMIGTNDVAHLGSTYRVGALCARLPAVRLPVCLPDAWSCLSSSPPFPPTVETAAQCPLHCKAAQSSASAHKRLHSHPPTPGCRTTPRMSAASSRWGCSSACASCSDRRRKVCSRGRRQAAASPGSSACYPTALACRSAPLILSPSLPRLPPCPAATVVVFGLLPIQPMMLHAPQRIFDELVAATNAELQRYVQAQASPQLRYKGGSRACRAAP